MKKLNINFISLFRYALLSIVGCKNLRFRDVALYYSILQCWNKYRFPEFLSVNQHELMQFLKIGSANTYRAALYNLEKHGFIKYYPSRDPSLGSKIFICIDKSVIGQKLILPRVTNDPELSSSLNNSKQDQTYQIPEKKEVIDFFISNSSTRELAEKFFNHNESFDWQFNGQPILNWKPFAENYIKKNSSKREKTKSRTKSRISTGFGSGNFKTDQNEK